jgi:hypothetical protein
MEFALTIKRTTAKLYMSPIAPHVTAVTSTAAEVGRR